MFDKDVFGKQRNFGSSGRGGNTTPARPAETAPESTPAKPVTAEADAPSESGSKLIVGPNIKLKGAEITDCDTLVVEGRVEASMNSRVIQIHEGGTFTGKVEIDVAEVRGRFEGELTARKRLVVFASGRVSGKIRYGKVSIEDGGEIAGDISSLNTQRTDTRQGQAAIEAVRPAAVQAS
jgi:cytoskeletal protein CcmA (bactofilin family)